MGRRRHRRLKGGQQAALNIKQAELVQAAIVGDQVVTCPCGEQFVMGIHEPHAVYHANAKEPYCERQIESARGPMCQCNHRQDKHMSKAGKCTKCRCIMFRRMNRRK